MATPSVNELVRNIFKPLVDYAGRPDLLDKLYTIERDRDEHKRDYAFWKHLKVSSEGTFLFQGLRFARFFYRNDEVYVAICVEGLTDQDTHELIRVFLDYECRSIQISDFLFLLLAYRIDAYTIKLSYRERHQAKEIVEVADHDDFEGHDIDNIYQTYKDIYVFYLGEGSTLRECNQSYVMCVLLGSVRTLRSPLISDDIANELLFLSCEPGVDAENVYFALTSFHWKQIYLDIYKYLEELFPRIWACRVRRHFGLRVDDRKIASVLYDELGWRANEERSLRKLLEELDCEDVFDEDFLNTGLFAGVMRRDIKERSVAECIYQLRNENVHQSALGERISNKLSSSEWESIVKYICKIVRRLYCLYGGGSKRLGA